MLFFNSSDQRDLDPYVGDVKILKMSEDDAYSFLNDPKKNDFIDRFLQKIVDVFGCKKLILGKY